MVECVTSILMGTILSCFFFRMAVRGGVVSLSITWNCDLDLDFMETCLPKYSFRILEESGYNFRHAKYHEENRRTLYKMYGIKVNSNKI